MKGMSVDRMRWKHLREKKINPLRQRSSRENVFPKGKMKRKKDLRANSRSDSASLRGRGERGLHKKKKVMNEKRSLKQRGLKKGEEQQNESYNVRIECQRGTKGEKTRRLYTSKVVRTSHSQASFKRKTNNSDKTRKKKMRVQQKPSDHNKHHFIRNQPTIKTPTLGETSRVKEAMGGFLTCKWLFYYICSVGVPFNQDLKNKPKETYRESRCTKHDFLRGGEGGALGSPRSNRKSDHEATFGELPCLKKKKRAWEHITRSD